MPDSFQKFTEPARKVLTLAQMESQRLAHNYIGTEHILLGLVGEGEGVAAKVLKGVGVELEKARSNVEYLIGKGQRDPQGNIGLTPRSKKIIELAVDEADRLNHHYIGTEHLLLGLIKEGEGVAARLLQNLGVNLEKTRQQIITIINQATYSPASQGSKLEQILAGENAGPQEARLEEAIERTMPSTLTTVIEPEIKKGLAELGKSLLDKARENELDPLVGREKELERILQGLNRRTDPHVLLVGESGVGKMAVMNGVAYLFALKPDPDIEDVIEVRQSKFTDFIRRPARFFKLLDKLDLPVVLCVAQFDHLVDYAARNSRLSALFDLIDCPKVRLVVSTSPLGLRRIKELEPSILRYFLELELPEPDEAETLHILRGVKLKYEQYHEVWIDDSALEMAVLLSEKYLKNRLQPARAISLLDLACSMVALRRGNTEEEMEIESPVEIEQIIEHQIEEAEDAVLKSPVTAYEIIEAIASLTGSTVEKIEAELDED